MLCWHHNLVFLDLFLSFFLLFFGFPLERDWWAFVVLSSSSSRASWLLIGPGDAAGSRACRQRSCSPVLPQARLPLLFWDWLCSHCLENASHSSEHAPSEATSSTGFSLISRSLNLGRPETFTSSQFPWHIHSISSLQFPQVCHLVVNRWTCHLAMNSLFRQRVALEGSFHLLCVSDTIILCLRGGIKWVSECGITSILNLYQFPKSCVDTLIFHLMEVIPPLRIPV